MVLERAYPFPESDRVFSASPRARSQIIAFFGLLKYFQTSLFSLPAFYTYFLYSEASEEEEKKYHDVISFYVHVELHCIEVCMSSSS